MNRTCVHWATRAEEEKHNGYRVLRGDVVLKQDCVKGCLCLTEDSSLNFSRTKSSEQIERENIVFIQSSTLVNPKIPTYLSVTTFIFR